MKYFLEIRKENIIYLFKICYNLHFYILYFEYLYINENVKESELDSVHNNIHFF
jgi:hypothetical protein